MKIFNQTCMALAGVLCMYFAYRLCVNRAYFGTGLFLSFALLAFWNVPKMKGRNQ